ncbi:hypothetical protein [Oryzibacter oryziterrae]|uniref:hypothetical protein n=1 Tax=Oryzibacter oryziterrae TaxID=2766474 RepID=UPI001F48202B|nr:hypothetical protein [Oryzibacter oryziterrae]
MMDVVRSILALTVGLLLAGCVSTKPDPLRRGDLGLSYKPIGNAAAPMLAACGSDPMAMATHSSVSSWLETLRHVDSCDLAKVRYYTSDEVVAPLKQRIVLMSLRPDVCGGQARALSGRVDRLLARLESLKQSAVPYCSVSAVEQDINTSIDKTQGHLMSVDSAIHANFPQF